MPRGKPKSKSRPALKIIDRKPIRPLERQRMRPWLKDLLNEGNCQQLNWINREEQTFRVSWKHAAGQTFDPTEDATLFELWARHTGKYYPGDRPDPKKWKANFRCALHSLQDVDEDKSLGQRRGNNAFRVYRFLDEKRVKKSISRSESVKEEDSNVEDELLYLRRKGTKSRPRKFENDEFDSEGSENGYSSPSHDGYSPSHESNHSDWDLSTDDLRRQDHDTEEEQRSPLPNFEELCQSCPNVLSSKSGKNYFPPTDNSNTNEENMELEEIDEVIEHSYADNEQSQGPTLVLDFNGNFDPEAAAEAVEIEYMEGFWNSVIDTSLDVQEEVVSSDAPNVIVLEERPDYNFEYTCLEQL